MIETTSPKWDSLEYQRISSAERRGDDLVVLFEDGSWVGVDTEQVLPPGTRGADWGRMSFTPYEIVVPTADGEFEIPWSSIRALTDKAYSAHLAAMADEQARQIGLRIKELRERRNLSGKELAERAGLTPQSLSRIEHGKHDVVFTTLQRILAAMGWSLRDLAATPTEPPSVKVLLKRLAGVGIDPDVVVRRIVPKRVRDRLRHGVGPVGPAEDEALAQQVAAAISHVYDWSVSAILAGDPLRLEPALLRAARFKTPTRIHESRTAAYAIYAHRLAALVSAAAQAPERTTLPNTPAELREAVAKRYGALTFDCLVRFSWDCGVPVIPLRDPGAFHGACWHLDGKDVIIIKQVTDAHARWIYDYGHEYKHIISHLSAERPAVIEREEISPFIDSDEEWEASDFATDLVLFGRAEELANRCVHVARGSVERLKFAVQQVGEAEHVPVDALANYMAFRLSRQAINWWGAANNLQVTSPAPWQIARDVLLERVDLDLLARGDRELLLRALSNPASDED